MYTHTLVVCICVYKDISFSSIVSLQNSRRSSTTKLSPEYRFKERISLKTAVLTDIDSREGQFMVLCLHACMYA